MRRIQLDSCPSTQSYLKDLLVKEGDGEQVLVSTKMQSEGLGRRSKSWKHFEGSLAFSFNIKACSEPSLTSLEIAIQIINYFHTLDVDLKLKWPNDIIHEDGKCGGIILSLIENNTCVVGIGLNINSEISSCENFDFLPSTIMLNLSDMEMKELPEKIVEYINKNRLDPEIIRNNYDALSIHRGKQVRITDDNSEILGRYLSIGEKGEAIIESPCGELKKVVTGTLRLV